MCPFCYIGKRNFENACILLYFLYFSLPTYSQQNHAISNIFRGTLVGLGWGAGSTSGSISNQIYFDCSSCNVLGNVYLISIESTVFDSLEFGDLIPATIKTFFFGFAIGLVGCFKGYTCKKGTVGVGFAANSAVVFTSMFLFIIDFIAVFVTNIFYDL